MSQNTEMTTDYGDDLLADGLKITTHRFKSSYQVSRRFRFRVWRMRRRMTPEVRMLHDALGEAVERAFLFGESASLCDRCNTMASCKLTGYECMKTGRAP